ncbi:protein FAM228A isoform X3 [Lepisosteus oculatus]|uniref:protein FAM228A isoform X3 n=1 Tax=Lepisosteus oculatus TaxID=7918 RepID=UPI0035F50E22
MPVKVKNTISKGSIIMHSTDPILFQNSDTKEPAPQPLRDLDKDQVVSMSGSRRSHSARNKIPWVSDCVLKRKDAVDWLSRNPFTRMQAKLHAENHEAQLLAQSVLDTENGFVKELDNYLNYRDVLELRKKELLHKKWKECVSEPIQKQIKEHINKYCYQEAEQMRSMFLQYLDYCNTKGFVFLKDYDPREYNPFLLHINRPHYFKVSTPILEDPLLIQHQDRMKEKGIVLQCQTGTERRPVELQIK